MADSLNPQLVFASNVLLPFIVDCPGPVNFNGARYVVCNAEPSNFSTEHLRMFKSTDDGLTWVQQDSANAPAIQTGGSANQAEGVGQFYPKAGGDTIYYCYCDAATSNLTLISYSMTTDTWGSPIGGGPNISATPPDSVLLFRRSDTSFVVLYGVTLGSPAHQCFGVVYNGSWGSPHTIPFVTDGVNTSNYNVFIGAGLTDSDRVEFLIFQHLLQDIWYGSVDASNTWSTQVDTGIGFSGNFQNMSWGEYVTSIDTMVFPQSTYDSNGAGSISQGGVVKVHPTSAPVFTYETVNIEQFLDPAFDGLSVRVLLSPDGTTLRFFWLTHSLTVPANNNIFYADQTVGTTSWSTSTLLWNYVANPLNPTPPITGVEPVMTASWSSDGELGILVCGWVDISSTSFCDIEYYLSVHAGSGPTPPPPQPSLACPIVNIGTVGVPFSAQLIASGGTPPYTFSVIP